MTIKEIASMAGVSIGTVDRVINHRPGVKEETRLRIEAIIAKSGFRANAYARNLKLGKKARVGVLIPRPESEYGYWTLVLKGIKKAGNEFHQFGLEIIPSFFDRDINGDFTTHIFSLIKVLEVSF